METLRRPQQTQSSPSAKDNVPYRNIVFKGSVVPKLTIGDGSYINGMDLYCWSDQVQIEIGKYCSIADKVTFVLGGEHDKDWVTTYPIIDLWQLSEYYSVKKPRFKGNIILGNDVWIANNVTVLSGVRIGDGAVVAAGSVVVKDVAPYAIVGGNPAKLIKYRFSHEIIEGLKMIKWWDWDRETILREMVPFITSPEEFLRRQQTKFKADKQ